MTEPYTLFYSPASCSMAVHAVLNAIGADFKLVSAKINGKENRTEEYLRLNPLGQVPVLVQGDHTFRESAAIMMYLLDGAKHPLLPQSGMARADAIQWLMFFNSTMHQAYGAYFLMAKNLKTQEAKDEALTLASKRIQKLWNFVNEQIHSSFLCGDAPTAGDILLTVIANWSSLITPAVDCGDKVRGIITKIIALPYVAKAIEAEGVHYKIP